MSLSPGTGLGPYETGDQPGAGGKGEVCRARDVKLEKYYSPWELERAIAGSVA